jgi:hypothetical protein
MTAITNVGSSYLWIYGDLKILTMQTIWGFENTMQTIWVLRKIFKWTNTIESVIAHQKLS